MKKDNNKKSIKVNDAILRNIVSECIRKCLKERVLGPNDSFTPYTAKDREENFPPFYGGGNPDPKKRNPSYAKALAAAEERRRQKEAEKALRETVGKSIRKVLAERFDNGEARLVSTLCTHEQLEQMAEADRFINFNTDKRGWYLIRVSVDNAKGSLKESLRRIDVFFDLKELENQNEDRAGDGAAILRDLEFMTWNGMYDVELNVYQFRNDFLKQSFNTCRLADMLNHLDSIDHLSDEKNWGFSE